MKYPSQLLKAWIVLIATLILASCGGAGSDTSRLAGGLTLTSAGQNITAKVIKSDGLPLPNSVVVLTTTLGSFDPSYNKKITEIQTNISGIATAKLYPYGVGGAAIIEAASGGYNDSTTVNISSADNGGGDGGSNLIGSMTLVPTSAQAYANGRDVIALDLKTYSLSSAGTTSIPRPNTQVNVVTSAGSLSATLDMNAASKSIGLRTDAFGQARLYLQVSDRAGTLVIRASSEGVLTESTVMLIADIPSEVNSSLSALPSSLPADGMGTATITLSLRDANNNLVADGTPVTLQTTAGTVTSPNPVTTVLGRAIFTLQAPTTPTNATLSIVQYPGVISTVTFGSQSSGNPANLEFNIANKQLFVFGVGKQDTTSLTISVKTAAGNFINDSNLGAENLEVSLKTRPSAGEKLIGKNATGSIVEGTTIRVLTVNGVATLTLQSGTLPGIVEIEAKTLLPVGTTLIGIVPQVSIASGPPKSINLSYPVSNSLQNMGSGVYRRVGSVFVTDQFGNAVPDGTAISLGVLDSVIVSNNSASNYAVNAPSPANASVTADSASLTDNSNTTFSTAFITRNSTSRFVNADDRVLLLNAQPENKSRFAGNVSGNIIQTNKPYKTTESSLSYVVGSSLLGAQIEGVNMQTGSTVVGQAATKDGYATFYLRYPADNQHILTGCFQGDPKLDTRATAAPPGSAQVWVVAESSETGATTIDNRACFSGMLNYQLVNESGVTAISSTTTLNLSLRDANLIQLPFVELSGSVVYETNLGVLNVSIGNCSGRTDRRTAENGVCRLPITVTGGASGDSATITIGAPGNAAPVSISVSIP